MIGALALPALADDLNPPSWRGEYSTTSQVWQFDYDSMPGGGTMSRTYYPNGPAAGGEPPLGTTFLMVHPVEPWFAYDPTGATTRQGIWGLSGEMYVRVENHEPPNEYKWVWMQLTWSEMVPGAGPSLWGLDPAPVAPPELVETRDLGGGWFESTYQWFIEPNPEWEAFNILGDIYVDELIVDTWCIPEPATLFIMGCGIPILSRLRRRR